MAIEIEKKYRLTEPQRNVILAALSEYGAEHIGDDNEENTIFGSDTLLRENAVVRIRRTDQKALLTFKQRLEGISDAKRQIEVESEIADADNVARILNCLQLEAKLIYEKRRRTWRFRSVDVMIDELPFGLYLEIEGSITGIKEAEMLLGADELEPEPETYPRLTASRGILRDGVIEARFDR